MIDSPYASILHLVEKPGRYTGGEFGSVAPRKDAQVRMALCFPDAYEIGMSHMGLSILYEIVNRDPRFCAERCFMPWPDMEALMRQHGLPLVALESMAPLSAFDAVGFSLQYELTFTNLLAMLDLGGIPRRADRRREGDPIVMVGGPVSVESEPLSPFVDLVVTGDGEEALPALLDRLAGLKADGVPRQARIDALAAFPFAYAPGRLTRTFDPASSRLVARTEQPVARTASIARLSDFPSGAGPLPMVAAVFDRYSMEIARGCAEGCRFCQAGYLYRPVRERSADDVAQGMKKAVCGLGYDEVSLSALSSADHSRIEEIVTGPGRALAADRVSLSVPSLRAYGLSDNVLEVLSDLRATGVTLAPEAGTRRLRDVVNKNITEADLLAAAERFFRRGFSRIKLYFMLGLPTETDDDLVQIIELCARLQSIGRRIAGKRAEITASVSTFVPKPFTPFEREEMIGPDEIIRRQKLLKELGFARRIRVKTHNPYMSELEGIFARGDASLADVLEKAVDLGARFDGWDDRFNVALWEEALAGVDRRALLLAIPENAPVPWDIIDTGVTAAFRAKERRLALDGASTAPCGVFEDGSFVCHACGLRCDEGQLPVRPRRPSAVGEPPEPVHHPRTGRHRPQPVTQGAARPTRMRLRLAFFGRQTCVGHLDTMRHLLRSFRRAGLNLWYTQGFHPMPRIEAPPPVPLGTAVAADPVDVWLADPPPPEEVLARLSRSLPPDLAVREVTLLPTEAPGLARSFNACTYLAFVRAPAQAVVDAVEQICTAPVIEVHRRRKDVEKTVDVKPWVVDIRLAEAPSPGVPLPDTAGRVAVAMTLRVPGSGGTRPGEVLGAFLPLAGDDLWVVRTGWLQLEEEIRESGPVD